MLFRRCLFVIIFYALSNVSCAFVLTQSEINADPSDWDGLEESQVFFKRLEHNDAGVKWVVKIGKGGQIYSIKIPGIGELIARQRASHGQWIDEVFQHTIPFPPQKSKKNKVVDGDIHQAGYYTKNDLDKNIQVIPQSIYSPLFQYKFNALENSISYITWPQHAHLPRKYAENKVLMKQELKDLGEGVIQITVKISKWGGGVMEKFSLPWSAFRTKILPMHIISKPDGSYINDNHPSFRKGKLRRLRDNSTGGWFAFVSNFSPTGKGIGIVYGKKPKKTDLPKSFVRWGNYGSSKVTGIGGTVATVKRSAKLEIGETLVYKYFIILGELKKIQKFGNLLESQVEFYKENRVSSSYIKVCEDIESYLGIDCDGSKKVLFMLQKNLTVDSKPVFLMQDELTKKFLISEDPYEISFNPTDKRTKYIEFLGWSLPKGAAVDKCTKPLSELLPSFGNLSIGKGSKNILVRRFQADVCE